jgi:hypothetical protein
VTITVRIEVIEGKKGTTTTLHEYIVPGTDALSIPFKGDEFLFGPHFYEVHKRVWRRFDSKLPVVTLFVHKNTVLAPCPR